jgi:hypothetical protein
LKVRKSWSAISGPGKVSYNLVNKKIASTSSVKAFMTEPKSHSTWKEEFPILDRLDGVKKKPTTIVIEALLLMDWLIKKVTYFLTKILIIGVLFFNLHDNAVYWRKFQGYDRLSLESFPSAPGGHLSEWKMYRNGLIIFVLADFLITIALGIYWSLNGNHPKAAKTVARWLKMCAFLLFSYAIAGLLLDLIFFLIFFHTAATHESVQDVMRQFFSAIP